jgi:hypothetical protein
MIDGTRAVVLLDSPEAAKLFLRKIRPQFTAAVMQLPAPKPQAEYVPLSPSIVTVLRNERPTFVDVFSDPSLTQLCDAEALQIEEFNSVRIFNVFPPLLLKDECVWMELQEGLRMKAVRYGYVDAITYPESLEVFGLHTYVTIKFSARHAASAAQAGLAGQYYCGRPIITMLCNT